ncbi:MAG TPA: hypothetical protein VEL76_43135, partial [Gemmataceae bacterium]|nr:hypothetical protein [Gemmataceae bacterium]
MADRVIGIQTTTIPIVDTANDTIFLGTEHGLTTGQKVKYHKDSGGGTLAVGGLTDDTEYFVRDAGGGKIQLYDSEAHAKAGGDIATGGLVDLTSNGTGDNHQFNKFVDVPLIGEQENTLFGAVKFDPDPNNLRVIQFNAPGLRTGDAVVYHKGPGAAISGLTDGQTYFIIKLDETHAQLAMTRDDAFAGTAIALTSDAVGIDDTLTEVTHSIFADAKSGAGAKDVGVAGSVAINRAEVTTLAQIDSDITLADGNDAGSGIGAVKVRAHSTTDNTATAAPDGAGAVADSVGVGASFALNLLFNDT